MTRFATNEAIFLDNEQAALRLHTGSLTPSSSKELAESHELRKIWCRLNRATVAQEGLVQVKWIAEHQCIKANELADKLAKESCSQATSRSMITICHSKRPYDE